MKNTITEGIRFYNKLRKELKTGDLIAGKSNYTFSKWMKSGALQFIIDSDQKKSIPENMIIISYHIKQRGSDIDLNWVKAFGRSDESFAEVLNYLIEKYPL
jgi:hypothetical protein